MRKKINKDMVIVQEALKGYLGSDRELQVKNYIKCADLIRDPNRVLKYDTLKKLSYYVELSFKLRLTQ